MIDDNRWKSTLTAGKVISQIIRSEVILSIHDYFKKKDYLFVEPPILHESISKKKNEIYLSELGRDYSLNSSNALYLTAYASIYKKVYSISSTFRNEKNTPNHLIEFKMLEVETVNMTFDEMKLFIIELVESVLDALINSRYIAHYPETISRVKQLQAEFEPDYISYDNFVHLFDYLEESPIDPNLDISDADYLISKHLERPVMVTDYPIKLASWTAKRKDRESSYAINLLLPQSYGELCEGCERTIDCDLLRYKFKCANIDNLNWYIEAVKDISEPRCGFGLGIDRLVRWIAGSDSIDETVFFPRKKF